MAGFMMKKKEKGKDTEFDLKSKRHSIRRENHTGIPTQLKERVEEGMGVSLDDVQVHYNSTLPEKLDALAYTRGNQVEIGPGQERHLPHELGHVVQQKLGAVRANARHSSGVAMNTDTALERQADEIGSGKKVGIFQRIWDNIIQRQRRGNQNRQNQLRRVQESDANAERRTLAQWLENDQELLNEVRATYQTSPAWWSINPDASEVFYRRPEIVELIRRLYPARGHHPFGLALGGPYEQQMMETGDTLHNRNSTHVSITNLQRRVIAAIRAAQ